MILKQPDPSFGPAKTLSKSQIEALDQINRFNMEARYPEDLRAFYKKVNRAYAKKYLEVTKEFWKWLRKKSEA